MKAFSLIELVISLAILSVGLVGAMRVFPVGLRASQRSELRSRAGMVAQRIMESLKVTPCAQLTDGEETVDEFQVRTTVTEPQVEHVTEPGRLKTIDVHLTWTQEGRPREFGVITHVRCDTS